MDNILSQLRDIQLTLEPLTKKHLVSLEQPSLLDNRGRVDRLKEALAAKGMAVSIPLSLMQELMHICGQDSCQLTATVGFFESSPILVDIEVGDNAQSNLGLAIDIGTTTVVTYLINMLTGKVLATASAYNSQICYGENILERIHYADNEGGLQRLQDAVLTTLNELISSLLDSQGLASRQLTAAVISGNTTMVHLLLGLSPASLCREPYIPVINSPGTIAANQIGLLINPHGPVYILPSIGSYVGGDVIAGVLVSQMHLKDEVSLLVDIGTNGEMVLGNSQWLVACAGAAGPALEGGVVKWGMRAEPGAIEKVVIDPITRQVSYQVIGEKDEKPKGLCGSGLVDCLAGLFMAGIIDRSGRFKDGREYYQLVAPNKTAHGQAILISQHDIKNLIRTKGAVNASLEVLMESVGCQLEDLTYFFTAGAFGNYLNPQSAVAIGLFPDLPPEQMLPIGNSAGAGARLALLSISKRQEAEELARKITYFEMNANQDFMNKFTAGLFLPHSNLDAYPRVKARLEELGLIK